MEHADAIVIGGGHNGLTCAAYLAEAGRSVVVLERSASLGGAVRSEQVFPGHSAVLSKYAYLVSLLPSTIVDDLGLDITLRRRHVASYTPTGASGILIDDEDPTATQRALGDDAAAWDEFRVLTTGVAERVFPTLTEPLLSASAFRRRVFDDDAWKELFERPLGETVERRFTDDTVRGIILTDALIGTFAHAHELAANRCFLYHVIGRGTGHWDVPVGGMGVVSLQLAEAARRRGVELRTAADVVRVQADDGRAVVTTADGTSIEGRQVFVNVAPAVLAQLLGKAAGAPQPEGAQLKINMLLSHLPRLRDAAVPSDRAFAGTFHVNEGYAQLDRAYGQARAGRIPELPPCEVYCHSLTDPTILSPELWAQGAQTLTLFALHMPARLFRDDPSARLQEAADAVIGSLDAVLDEPIRDCLLTPACIEVMGPLEIEQRLGMPGGHIFHRDLQWPFAERPADEGRWGVETAHPNVFICGAGARRGGGVSGIPGRNAAMAALDA